MSAIRQQFEERIGRAVSRFFHHAQGEGLKPEDLDGLVILRLEGGALTGIEFQPLPERAAVDPKRDPLPAAELDSRLNDRPEVKRG